MKIAIHHRQGSFSERWIEYCQSNNIEYKIVNAFASDIIQQVSDCDCFLWHYHHAHYKDVKAAKNILFALEHSGISTFPNFNTAWHFDDKIAQKYLLEAAKVPLVASYVFYDKLEAIAWINKASFPKVFKLKGGAGAKNVKLAKSKVEALHFIKKAFGNGFPQFDKLGNLKDRIIKYKNGRDNLIGISKALGRFLLTPDFSRQQPNERGYAYFQDFIPNNDFDIRVITINNRAFAIKRIVRDGDFRASGSGNIVYDMNEINLECIKMAFETHRKLSSQCTAFDFVFDGEGKPLIIEISYGFEVKPYDLCPGYWDDSLSWYEESFVPQDWIIEGVIKEVI